MKRVHLGLGIVAVLLVAMSATIARAQTTTTVAVDLDPNSATGIRIEGLVSDSAGRLYTSDTASRRLWRYTPSSNALETLGELPRPASGMAFDKDGNLYMASSDVILKIPATTLSGTSVTSDTVQTFAAGVTGANGLAFDGTGNLYVSGGATGNIYLVASDGVTKTWATGFTSERADQQISTNGLAFWTDGMLYSSNTGTGAIDRIAVNTDGTAGTVQRWVTDPLLLGADGITFASNGDLYVAANERNAIVKVSQAGVVTEVMKNDNNGPLEFPASPAFSGNALYASNFDIERGANAPAAPGVGGSLARIDVGVSGLPLPVGAAGPVAQPTSGAGSPTAETGTTTPVTGATETATVAPVLPTLEAATAVPTTVIEQPTALPTIVLPPPSTVNPPGMPSTGAGDGLPAAVIVILLLAAVATLAGVTLRLKGRTTR
ncbi:MAG: SMP-30/gluconolactonase/LRE family protein [Chloroflexota bacterium]